MRSFGVLGAAILAAWSFAAPAQAQAPAGATGAAPGTAPNAPPPPAAAPAAGTAPTGTPDVARAPAGNDQPSGSPGAITAETVGQRSVATSYQAKAAEQNLTAAGARADQQWTNYLPRVGLTARYTRLSDFTPPSITGGGSLVATQAPAGTLNPTPTVAAGGFTFPLVLDNYLTQATIAVPISDYLLRIGKSYSASTHVGGRRALRRRRRSREIVRRRQGCILHVVASPRRGRRRRAIARGGARAPEGRGEPVRRRQRVEGRRAARADAGRFAPSSLVERAKSGVALTERQVRIAIHGKDEEVLTPGDSLEGALPSQPASLKTLVAEAELQRPEIKSIDKSAEAARKLADVSRAGRYPVLSGFGDVTYANPNQRRLPADVDVVSDVVGRRAGHVVSERRALRRRGGLRRRGPRCSARCPEGRRARRRRARGDPGVPGHRRGRRRDHLDADVSSRALSRAIASRASCSTTDAARRRRSSTRRSCWRRRASSTSTPASTRGLHASASSTRSAATQRCRPRRTPVGRSRRPGPHPSCAEDAAGALMGAMGLNKGDRVAVLTSGGDAPGMNAALRAAARVGAEIGLEMRRRRGRLRRPHRGARRAARHPRARRGRAAWRHRARHGAQQGLRHPRGPEARARDDREERPPRACSSSAATARSPARARSPTS